MKKVIILFGVILLMTGCSFIKKPVQNSKIKTSSSTISIVEMNKDTEVLKRIIKLEKDKDQYSIYEYDDGKEKEVNINTEVITNFINNLKIGKEKQKYLYEASINKKYTNELLKELGYTSIDKITYSANVNDEDYVTNAILEFKDNQNDVTISIILERFD